MPTMRMMTQLLLQPACLISEKGRGHKSASKLSSIGLPAKLPLTTADREKVPQGVMEAGVLTVWGIPMLRTHFGPGGAKVFLRDSLTWVKMTVCLVYRLAQDAPRARRGNCRHLKSVFALLCNPWTALTSRLSCVPASTLYRACQAKCELLSSSHSDEV